MGNHSLISAGGGSRKRPFLYPPHQELLSGNDSISTIAAARPRSRGRRPEALASPEE